MCPVSVVSDILVGYSIMPSLILFSVAFIIFFFYLVHHTTDYPMMLTVQKVWETAECNIYLNVCNLVDFCAMCLKF